VTRDQYGATPNPTNLDTARKCAGRAHTARSEVRGRLGGLRALFGPEVAESVARPLETFEDQVSEAFAYYEDAITDVELVVHTASQKRELLRQDVAALTGLLLCAIDDEDKRQNRKMKSARRYPMWYRTAKAAGITDPEPF
jgi:hypothetical protein